MQTMRQSWTDERLGDFRAETARRFEEAKAETARRFEEAKAETARRFDEVDRRLDGVEGGLRDLNHRVDDLQRTLVLGAIAMTGAILAGFGGLAGLLAALL
ncbi:MAG TPA: hypothetical protein VFU04_08410 [Solirubrobacterales bacterium]|nr:hypothetical protein [Solirubrobacterales bacterium]